MCIVTHNAVGVYSELNRDLEPGFNDENTDEYTHLYSD